MSLKPNMRILISRTDTIGDVMLMVPICGVLMKHYPDTQIFFLLHNYTQPLLRCCIDVFQVLNYDEW